MPYAILERSPEAHESKGLFEPIGRVAKRCLNLPQVARARIEKWSIATCPGMECFVCCGFRCAVIFTEAGSRTGAHTHTQN